MNNRHAVRMLVIVSIVTIFLAGMTANHVLSGPPQPVKVIITYKSPPGLVDRAEINNIGGQVKYRYHLIPAIAATLPEAALYHLRNNSNVLRIEPDLPMHAVEENYVPELDNAWGVKHINAGTVHNTYENRGQGVNIAIIDSGINYNHPDLNENYMGGDDFVDGDGDPMDVYGHGTHVAGIACAENNDNGTASSDGEMIYGVVGVAPECNLYALKVLDNDGWGVSSDLIAALEWAVTNTMHVANLSLGWDMVPPTAVETAFQEAYDAGLVIVAAACNNGNRPGKGENVCYPGKYPTVIAVAATDIYDSRATFSSTGTEVELAAPGVAVYSTWNDTDGYYAPDPVCHTEEGVDNVCYKYGSGTSMASPHVAGVAALMIASGMTDNVAIRQQLRDTATDLGNSLWYGYGLVNAVEAVQPTTPTPLTDIAVTGINAPATVTQGSSVDILVSVTNVGNQDVTDDISVELWDITGNAFIDSQMIGGLAASNGLQLTFTWMTENAVLGPHIIQALDVLSDDNVENNTRSISISVNDPTVQPLTIVGLDPTTVLANQPSDLTLTGSGFVDTSIITFEDAKGATPTVTSRTIFDGGSKLVFTVVTKWSPKTVSWTVRVTNPNGDTAIAPVKLTVSPP